MLLHTWAALLTHRLLCFKCRRSQQRRSRRNHVASQAPWRGKHTCSYRLLPRNACAVGCSLTCCVIGVVWWGSVGDLCRMPQRLRERQAESQSMWQMPKAHSTGRAAKH